MNPPPFAMKTHLGWLIRDGAVNWIGDAQEAMMPEPALLSFKRTNHLIKDRAGMVIDVGAYCGDTAQFFLNLGREVAAFEPQNDAFWCLLMNCPPSDRCQIYNLALGNGEAFSYMEFAEGTENCAGRWLLKGGNNKTYRLDQFGFTNVALLKIDVEGFEPLVLEGSAELLARERPAVMIEYNHHALARQNFTVADIEKFFPADQWDRETVFQYNHPELGEWGDWVYTPK